METIKAIIGLGNPGRRFTKNRHNIGFRIVDRLAQQHDGSWSSKGNMEQATIQINSHPVLLVKPQTYMNNSGEVIPQLKKRGIGAEHILVVHDELEKPFSKLAIKDGGSHRGHNGLRSIIEYLGNEFKRLRFGVGRPEDRADVGDYVLRNFPVEVADEVEKLIEQSVEMIEELF